MALAAQWMVEEQRTLLPLQTTYRFVARQPIVDRMRKTFGYELLFRTSWENRFCADGEAASRHMLDNAVSFGLDSIVGSTVPFVNCTRSLLMNRMPSVLPQGTVLEVLEDVDVDMPLIQACRELSVMGYDIALDDFDFTEKWELLIPFAKYIKLDFRACDAKRRMSLMARLRFHDITFIAEKVEDEAEFQQAVREGFHLFQGYYFMKPVVMARPSLLGVLNKLRFLAELSKAEMDREQVVRLLKEEPSIGYRVLRVANSAAMGLRHPVKTLECALTMVGEEQFRRLATLAIATEFSGGASLEPIRYILQRARMCELLGVELGLVPGEMYLFGMMSVVKKALQLSPEEMCKTLRLSDEVRDALGGAVNAYWWMLELADACERGLWEQMERAAAALRLHEAKAAARLVEAQAWAEGILQHACEELV